MTEPVSRPAAHDYVKLKMHASQLPLEPAGDRSSLDANKNKLLRLRGYLVVFGGILVINGCCGLYSFGNIVPYLASYWTYLHFDKNPSNYDAKLVENKYESFTNLSVWTYTALLVFWCFLSSFGGQFELLFGPRRSTFFGAFATGASVALSFFTCHDFYLTTLTFGIMFGISNSLVYTPPIVVGMYQNVL